MWMCVLASVLSMLIAAQPPDQTGDAATPQAAAKGEAAEPLVLPTYTFEATQVPKDILFTLVNTRDEEMRYAVTNGTFRHLSFGLWRDGQRVQRSVEVELAALREEQVHTLAPGAQVTLPLDLSSRYWDHERSVEEGVNAMDPGVYVLVTVFGTPRNGSFGLTEFDLPLPPAAIVVITGDAPDDTAGAAQVMIFCKWAGTGGEGPRRIGAGGGGSRAPTGRLITAGARAPGSNAG